MDRAFNKILKHIPQPASSSSQPSSSSSSSSPHKRGLAWPVENADTPLHFTRPGSKVSWLYNWSPNPTPSSSLAFVPMAWNQVHAPALASSVSSRSAQQQTVLGFNEPELPDQAGMTPELAADAWIEHVEPLRRSGVRAGSPGISSAPQGVKWLGRFLELIRARGSDVDFLAMHWYGVDLGGFYDYIWSTHHQLDPSKKVWITEFAPTNWNEASPLGKEHVEHFVRESCRYLDGLDWVERYAFFGAMRNTGNVGRWAAMLDEKGSLTDTGKIYRDC